MTINEGKIALVTGANKVIGKAIVSLVSEFGIAAIFAVITGVVFEAIKSAYTIDFKLYIKNL